MFLELFFLILNVLCPNLGDKSIEDERGVKLPNKCEVCKYLAVELQQRIDETAKINDKLKIGYNLMEPENYRTKDYRRSELRLIEIMDGICDNILQYNVHKERQGSLRFAKGQSETMSTLHGLRKRGVKVELGIPEELWDSPSAEITDMKRKCEMMMETYMDNIETWYFNYSQKPMVDYLCKENMLATDDQECLKESWTGLEKVDFAKEQSDEDTNKKKKLEKKVKKAKSKKGVKNKQKKNEKSSKQEL